MKLHSSIILFFILLNSCKPKQEPILFDADDNKYLVKKYGETIWMTENLKVTQDESGKSIKYYAPNGDSFNIKEFGLLYDFEAACTVCPDGWELPTNVDWDKLFKSCGGNAANIYKDKQYWESEINSNSSFFSARPAGYGNNGEHNNHFNARAIFWSKSKEDDHFVWAYSLQLGLDSIQMASQHPTYAFSVRCIKSKD